ncbi:hypothetical protein CU098_010183 [Rhizopus stolonifer]|uniref:CRIB domain-containing protein n=1 Tax=Rhizopus stolonifer TaxID=4846 RepID=A0A367KL30_RHIST|nr:hypothetical protein CU098_010183 [Rhizopus stolonifer]
MGSSISKVNCGDITIHKKYNRHSHRRPTIKIDKSQIGKPTDFRHTYHVGNNSPVTDEFLDGATKKESANSDLLATMAQITDALQKFPLHTARHQYSPMKTCLVSPLLPTTTKIGVSHSDQQISRHRQRRPVPSLTSLNKKKQSLETSTSMIISSAKLFDDGLMKNLSEKEKNILHISKSSSAQTTQHSPILKAKDEEEEISTMDVTGGYYDFSSCLQSRIDAQIIEIARARSKNKNIRSPKTNNNLLLGKPAIMI